MNALAWPMCRFEWGWRGARTAAERGDVLAVIDVLSFSTTAVTAAQRGAVVYPCLDEEEARDRSLRHGAEIAVRREDVPARGRFSLSPSTFLMAGPIDRIAVPSPNGATCCRIGASAPSVLIGSLLNASAAARAATLLMNRHRANLTVIACGERWTESSEEGQLRFALEDYLGAGALIAALDVPTSPEALVCRAAFSAIRTDLLAVLAECASGIELSDRGWFQDVEFAACHDICDAVPLLMGDCLQPGIF
jgi:2-phosphosulfolactate phosphatase